MHVEDDAVLAETVDHALELADHGAALRLTVDPRPRAGASPAGLSRRMKGRGGTVIKNTVIGELEHAQRALASTARSSAARPRCWAWVRAMASASAASAVFGSALGSSTRTIMWIWSFSA